MSDVSTFVGPVIFKGGRAAEYAVEVLKNGGLGTRHLPSGNVVPHVLSKVSAEGLKQGFGSGPASAALQAAQSGLAVANLGVGLLNLGVSTWTAWKVHKMDKKLDVIVDSVDQMDGKLDDLGRLLGGAVLHLDHLIRGNSLLLGVIIENQGHLGHGVALLREEVARGFRSVHDALSSTEAKREAQELEQQMRSLFRYYELCTREMQAGRQPPAADLRRITDIASNLAAWLDTRIAAIAVGRTERLPLLVARSFALRLEVDARGQLDEAPGGRVDEVGLLRAVIRGELHALTEGASVFALAAERRDLVEQYVYLNRALASNATMIEFADGSMVPYYPLHALAWDDGLEPVRRAVAHRDGGPAPARLELNTLEEHQSLQRLLGLPRGATEDEVEYDVLARALGLPTEEGDGVVSEIGLRELLRLGPSAAADAKTRIRRES